MIGRLIGWLFLVAGLAVLVRDFWTSFDVGHWAPISLGQLWYDLSQSSLNLLRAAIENTIGLRAWQVLDAMLLVWASLALIVIGMGLLLAFRRRTDIVE